MTDAQKRERHRRWLESLGFSAEDWRRIKNLAADVTPNYCPAALDDLSVPIRVGACRPNDRTRTTGRLLGSWRGVALLYWPMTERERETWAKRRAGQTRRQRR